MLEKKLFNLFDFQKYEGNEKLSKVIEETEKEFGEEISMDDLYQVSAAICCNDPSDNNNTLKF